MKIAIVLNAPSLNLPIAEPHIVCADGGLCHLTGQTPLAVVGDFDSLPQEVLAKLGNTPIVRHNPHKNETDGALAVRYAITTLGATSLVIYGALGGRIDHVLSNLALLSLAHQLGAGAAVVDKTCTIRLLGKGKHAMQTTKGKTLSLLPYGGDALVAESQNLLYPLTNLLLTAHPYEGRGTSNVATTNQFGLTIAKGFVLLVENHVDA